MPKQELTWEEAIQTVLREERGPLHYAEIAERITSQGLKAKVGATPAASVAATISTSLKGGDSPFVKVAKGQFGLRSDLATSVAADEEISEIAEPDTGAVRAFGMFWQRDKVLWSGKARLLGRQSLGASEVNFAAQVGIYLLQDRDRVIYVGRAADTLFARLLAHNTDRLGGRWDRFSWFGMKKVAADGSLAEATLNWTHEAVIETMEALLIESLEPPLNRRRGDNFSASEYLQTVDPELERLRKQQIIQEALKGVG